MFQEVDASLRTFLGGFLPEGTTVGFDPPGTQDSSTEARISLFLYDVQEDTSGRAAGWSEIRDDQHRVIERRLALRRYEMSYLVTATASCAEDEHRLLGTVLTRLVNHEIVPKLCLSAALAAAEYPVGIRVGHPSALAPWQLWSILRSTPRACLNLVVTAPVVPDRPLDIPQPPDSLELGVTTASPPRSRPTAASVPAPPGGRRWAKVRIRETLSEAAQARDPSTPSAGSNGDDANHG